MAAITEGMHEGEFIGELAMGVGYHVDAITLSTGENLVAGAVLSKVETGVPSATAGTPIAGAGGTIGNGTISAVSADAGAMEGTWLLECTATGATGKFKVIKPDGTIDGILTIGTPYNGTGSINITVADGANDWLVGDIIPVVVVYEGDDYDPEYVEYDGTLPLSGLLVKNTDATDAALATTALVRGPAIVNKNDLTWFSGATAAEVARGVSDLMALGIKAV